MTLVKVYHRTSKDAAASILSEGFRDGETAWVEDENSEPASGVWVSSIPYDRASLGASPEDLVVASIVDDVIRVLRGEEPQGGGWKNARGL